MDGPMNSANRSFEECQVRSPGLTNDVPVATGVSLADLEPFARLVVRTATSLYRITVLKGTKVLVQGGKFFPDVAVADLNGSRLHGSLLKVGWIGKGLRMEILAGGRLIVTSPVRTVTIELGGPRARRPFQTSGDIPPAASVKQSRLESESGMV
jgi:hypothetical protein